MGNKINIAELLKDCPKGMELDCTIYNSVSLLSVDDREDMVFPIRVLREDGNSTALTKYGQFTDADFEKCVIFPKGKTTWEGFVPPCQFKDGDIVATDSGRWLGIIKNKYDFEYYTVHCAIDYTFNDIFYRCGEYRFSRLATEEEKAKLQGLPVSLDEALDCLEKDNAYLTEGGVFPEHLIKKFIATKRAECRRTRCHSHFPFRRRQISKKSI